MWWYGRCASAACCTDAVLLHETRAHVYDELRPLMVERMSCSVMSSPSAGAHSSSDNVPLPGMYTARHRATHELVALKVYRKRLLARHDTRRRLRREVRMLSLCREHPHLLTLYGVYSTSATVEIAFELARGGEVMNRVLEQPPSLRPSLTDALSPRPSPHYVYNEREVSRVIASVVAGLGFLHARGVVHGEVRPEHVLYCDSEPDARVVLADFGRAAAWSSGDLSLATRTQQSSRRRRQRPSFLWDDPHHVQFLPPFALARRDDHIATWREAQQLDAWALGVTMYVLLCAAFPFYSSGDSVARTIERVVTEPLVFPDDGATISRAARDLLSRLLVKDPEESLTLEQVAAHPWIQDSVASDVVWSTERLAAHAAFAAAYSDQVAAGSRRRRVSPAAYAYSLADRTERLPPHSRPRSGESTSSREAKSRSSRDDEDRDVFGSDPIQNDDSDEDVAERPSFVSTTSDAQQAIQQLAAIEDEPLSADAYMRLASDEIDACAVRGHDATPPPPPLRTQASVDTKLWRVLFKQRRFFSFRSASSSAGSLTKSDSDA